MYEDNHFCHPGGLAECALHTTEEIMYLPYEDTEFYAIIDEGVVGFVCFHSERKVVHSFGLTIAKRRDGRAAEFMKLIRNFGNKGGLHVRVCNTNKRDVLMLLSVGFAKGEEMDPDHLEMVCNSVEYQNYKNDLILEQELNRLYKLRMNIESERRSVMLQFKKRLGNVQLDINQITSSTQFDHSQLHLF